MVQTRCELDPLNSKLGIEIQKDWEEGCGKHLFFFYLQMHITAALFRSGFVVHGLRVTHAKSPFSEQKRRTPQDQDDLAPVYLGNRFAHKICIRDFLAIRSFNL